MTDDIDARLFAAADRVAMDPELLGVDPAETDPDVRGHQIRQAALLAGLLWEASIVLLDQLFDDVAEMRSCDDEPQWQEAVTESAVLCGLPPRFLHRIDPGVASKFLVVTVDLTSRLSRGWQPPACVAQELMLRLLLDDVESMVETYDVDLDDGWRGMLEDLLFEDVDHEFLYDRELDGFEDDASFGPPGMAPMQFERWFVPFNPARRLPPFAEDAPPGASHTGN